MFQQNVKAELDGGDIVIKLQSQELVRLYDKHSGVLNVKISKPQSAGTDQQNKTKHALEMAFFLTGMHSAPVSTIEEFKYWMKCQIGIVKDFRVKDQLYRVALPWEKYSKEERGKYITDLISVIEQAGAMSDPKIQEIIKGMAELSSSGNA